MSNDENKSSVDELRDKLYSRTEYKDPEDKRSPIESREAPEVGEKWNSPDLDEMLKYDRRAPEPHPAMKKIFTFALVFFIGAIAVTAFIFLGGSNFVSSKNVDISIVGPTSISAGDTLELGITVVNRNNADLQVANLSIQYPQGTKNPDNPDQNYAYIREELGELDAGREINRTSRAILFGEEGEVKQVKVSVEYKIKGSNATFYKDKIYEIVIGDTPITMLISQPPSVNSGDTLTTTITLVSASEEVLRNVVVRGEYPYGYSPTKSEPSPEGDNNLWALGDMSPGSKKVLTLEGILIGENDEERTFRFYVGVGSAGLSGPVLGTTLVSSLETVTIERPSLSLTAEFNGSRNSNYISPAGGSVNATIRYQNNLRDKILDPRLEVRLSGEALNEEIVSAQAGGVYNPSSNTIIWDLKTSDGVSELLPGASGQVSFNFGSLANLSASAANHGIGVNISLKGTSISMGGYPITATLGRTVKISSQATLSSKALHTIGPFSNQGPIPPKAEAETSYTIVFTAGNTMNDINNAKVTATLGQNVTWLGALTSGGENVSYDPATKKVTWNMEILGSGAGFSADSREAAFQVALKPSISQVGTAPTLVSGVSLTGTDAITGQAVSVPNSAITTRLSSDPGFVQGDDIVVR